MLGSPSRQTRGAEGQAGEGEAELDRIRRPERRSRQAAASSSGREPKRPGVEGRADG
jgi:hypothetical protein